MQRAALLAGGRGRVRFGGVKQATVLLIALLASGCLASIEGGPPRLFSIAEESEVARFRLTRGETAYYADPTVQNRRARNEIITARMRAIDTYYYSFEASLVRERQELGFISSIISIGLSGAVPLVSAVQTKNILGAASSGLQGASKAYSDEVLFQKTVQVLTTQMRARRDTVAADIITRMKTLDIDEYTLSMALGDVDEYYAAGTIAGALIEVNKTVGEKAQDAEKIKADTLVSFSFSSDDLTERINSFYRPNGAVDNARAKVVRELLKTYPGRPRLSEVLYRAENIDLRRRLARDLGLLR